MRLWQHYEWAKHAIEATVLVPFWPIRARRYMRKLRAEVDRADAENARLRRFHRLALGCAQTVCDGSESFTKVR